MPFVDDDEEFDQFLSELDELDDDDPSNDPDYEPITEEQISTCMSHVDFSLSDPEAVDWSSDSPF